MTEEEALAEQLCPKGKAPFTILEASVVESKSQKNAGKEMLKLKLDVHADDGFDYHVYDYVAPWFMAHKFRHFFFCIGAGKAYESGTVDPASLIEREGWCEVGHERAKGDFPPKAKIVDYVPENSMAESQQARENATAPSPAAPSPKPAESEDDVPF